jgi:hypothetical protein
MVKFYREEHPKYRIFGDRFSSRFNEYVFQYCRVTETNSPLCTVLGFKRHLRHFHLMINDAMTSGLKFPASKRGVPNDISRVDIAKHTAPPGWHLTDAEICSILDGMVGVSDGVPTGDCTQWWINILDCPEIVHTNLRNSKEFFSSPVEHFKKDDLWGAGTGGSDLFVNDPNNPYREDHDDVQEIEVIHVDEEQDAAVIFSRLVERSGHYGSDTGNLSKESTMRFYRDVCDKLKKFNNELIRLAQDRKFRFRVTKVFHGQSKEIKGSDKWDWYSEDDDALIVFQRAGISKFVIGNIQEIIVLNQVPSNKQNLTAGDALRNGEPKARTPLNFDPERVAMLVQTYDEADKDDKVLADYCQ